MYVQYKVKVSENQVDTLKDAFRLKKGVIRHQSIGQGASARETCTNSFEGKTSGKECKLYWRFYCYVAIARSGLLSGVLTKRLVAKVMLVMDSIYTNMINAIEYRK